MADSDWPGTHVIKADHGAIVIRTEALAANFVKAESPLMVYITELLHKTIFIKMGLAFAMIVNLPAVSKPGPMQFVHKGRELESYKVQHGREKNTELGGLPAILIMFSCPISSSPPTAPVGLGSTAWIPPKQG